MTAHKLAEILLSGPDLKVVVTTNVKGTSAEFIGVAVKNVAPNCQCEDCKRIVKAVEIFTD